MQVPLPPSDMTIRLGIKNVVDHSHQKLNKKFQQSKCVISFSLLLEARQVTANLTVTILRTF